MLRLRMKLFVNLLAALRFRGEFVIWFVALETKREEHADRNRKIL